MLALILVACHPAPPPAELTVLAAASLTDALPKVAEAWTAESGVPVVFSFDGSAKLAKQVRAGAPADLLFTADRETMDPVDDLLAPGTRADLFGNTLVVVVPADAAWVPRSAAALDAAGLTHLALAGENVPAGKYARASLIAADVWTALEPKVVGGDNVRTTLAWVTRGEAEAGVVYATDAAAEPGVTVAFALPDDSHPPIVYPGAVIAASAHPAEARSLLAFCASAPARAILARAGFTAAR